MIIVNLLLIMFSLAVIFIELKKIKFSFQLPKVIYVFSIQFTLISILIYKNTNDIILALKYWLLLMAEALFINIILLYIKNLSQKINKQIGAGLHYLVFFYTASPIAIISMNYNGFPNELLIINCFISFTALILILKYSISIVMSKEIIKISLLHQLFLLLILMTGSIFSFANFNYSINIVLNNISHNIAIMDYIFLYSSIFTLNYDNLVLPIGIDKLLASISMVYSYFFISTIVATIITRLNNDVSK